MDYTGVEAFLKIIRYGNLSHAAKDLNISQSALSKRIAILEEDLGQQLVIRSRGVKRAELTDAGFKFIPIAKRIQRVFSDIDEFSMPEMQNSLKISATGSLYVSFLRPCLDYHQESQQGGIIKCRAGNSLNIYQDIEDFRTELGFVTNVYDSHIAETIPFMNWGWVLCCGKNVARNEQYAELPMNREIVFNWGHEYIKWHKREYGAAEISFIGTENLDMYQTLLSSGDYWSIAPRVELERLALGGFCTIKPLTELRIKRQVYLVKRKNDHLSSAAKRFLAAIQVHYSSIDYITFSPEAQAMYEKEEIIW